MNQNLNQSEISRLKLWFNCELNDFHSVNGVICKYNKVRIPTCQLQVNHHKKQIQQHSKITKFIILITDTMFAVTIKQAFTWQ